MGKPTPLPHKYTVSLSDGRLQAPPREPIAAGAPPQFGGSETVWSPEELLVAATLTCLWTTFQAYARRDHLEIRGWSGTGAGVLDKGTPVPVFSSIALAVDVVVDAGEEERARKLLATAEAGCIISHALVAPVLLHANVTSIAAPACEMLG